MTGYPINRELIALAATRISVVCAGDIPTANEVPPSNDTAILLFGERPRAPELLMLTNCSDSNWPYFEKVVLDDRCGPCGAPVKKRGQLCARCMKARNRRR